jgi:hypothetical protein
VAFAPGGPTLATTSADQTITLGDLSLVSTGSPAARRERPASAPVDHSTKRRGTTTPSVSATKTPAQPVDPSGQPSHLLRDPFSGYWDPRKARPPDPGWTTHLRSSLSVCRTKGTPPDHSTDLAKQVMLGYLA